MDLRTIWTALALAGAAASPAIALAAAQSEPHGAAAANLSGHWTGTISEPRSTDYPQYTLSVHIDTDRNGRLVGEVHYEAFPCSGVWVGTGEAGGVWRFDETITNGGTRCARHVVIEARPSGNALEVRLWPVGMENDASSGRLIRRSP